MMMDENQRTVEEYQVEEHRTKEISAESRRVKGIMKGVTIFSL